MKRSYKLSIRLFAIALLSFNYNSYPIVDTYQTVFTAIYDRAIWGRNSEGYGTSGHGSKVQNTVTYRDLLEEFMKSHHITSVVDAGCGDWEFSQHIAWGTIKYVGYDIVEQVIRKNIAQYKAANINFINTNFLETDLPAADLLICKDVLQHLYNEDIIQFLKQISKFKYCLITNEVDPNTLSSNNDDYDDPIKRDT